MEAVQQHLAGLVGYFVLTKGTEAIDKDIDMGVLGGIISGVRLVYYTIVSQPISCQSGLASFQESGLFRLLPQSLCSRLQESSGLSGRRFKIKLTT